MSATGEDRFRAQFYAVLAHLYADAPDGAFLRALAAAEHLPGAGGFVAAWNELVAASGTATPDVVAQEYCDLFVGVGTPEVNLHASHWRNGAMHGKALAQARAELAALGLARQSQAAMVEDHLAALCETMRILIEREQPLPAAAQHTFFERHLAPWVFACCEAMRHSEAARYYARVAAFTSEFMALERDALAME